MARAVVNMEVVVNVRKAKWTVTLGCGEHKKEITGTVSGLGEQGLIALAVQHGLMSLTRSALVKVKGAGSVAKYINGNEEWSEEVAPFLCGIKWLVREKGHVLMVPPEQAEAA